MNPSACTACSEMLFPCDFTSQAPAGLGGEGTKLPFTCDFITWQRPLPCCSYSVPPPLAQWRGVFASSVTLLRDRHVSNSSELYTVMTVAFTRIIPIITTTYPITLSVLYIFMCIWPPLFLLTIL